MAVVLSEHQRWLRFLDQQFENRLVLIVPQGDGAFERDKRHFDHRPVTEPAAFIDDDLVFGLLFVGQRLSQRLREHRRVAEQSRRLLLLYNL